ncbi:Guanosine-5'-triphosphate,3'-diphosphate pyrophosphatase [Piscirickettsia salmonis]|uniref:Ppx/GppA phosphatase family protein n=1 Tax=Piscirickettsia salmonis TaxID=1238 RepID=A0AAC8VKT5_PISSA|nr:hypothetical protein [Piscirickettsia salmonis]ALB24174.1 ppx/GppA phosphatase family protein [Piscirickettsia salmonis]ALT18724.1 hypothetical protein PSLF89_183 [Piscirickettsia salmonis LF-89 = ATCC VR-1361]ALY03976.1 hypothetical protein AWE47_14820 [Piscirickettsia salmonis]AMA43540.1 hypothetical protein AWJ11_15045 [Piscirickettsia salmonis]AOS36009.1 hypothetical protein AVM72_12160 [Piscirickettsia salmonis]
MKQSANTIAAIDLGTNSFHLIIATIADKTGEVEILQRSRERVQLGAGFTAEGHLDSSALQRACQCLKHFNSELKATNTLKVKAVGTSALRDAKNQHEFLIAAERALGYPIDIITGEEEARLIYLGVLSSFEQNQERLIIDIGGGSTELIAGFGSHIHALTSLDIGCLRYKELFFKDGQLTEQAFQAAIHAAYEQIDPIIDKFHGLNWQGAWGASGTIQSVVQVIKQLNLIEAIDLNALQTLKTIILKHQHVDELQFKGLKPERRTIFPSGLAILIAIFSRLQINHLSTAKGALREGLIHVLRTEVTKATKESNNLH